MESSGFTVDPAPDDRPWPGGKCTVCRNGILFPIAETEEGWYLACFNCETRGTVHKTEPWVATVAHGEGSPTAPGGFTVTHQQAHLQAAGGDPDRADLLARQAARPITEGERADFEAKLAELQAQLDEKSGGGKTTPKRAGS